MTNNWVKNVEYDLNILKSANPIPGLVKNLSMQIPVDTPIKKFYNDLLIILTELYNNSLDHGILELSSHYKENSLEEYYQIRKELLSNLKSGCITFHFDLNLINKMLKITISDSGQGFDYKKYLQSNSNLMLHKLSGRGLYIINHLVDKIRYDNNGSTISVSYNMSKSDQALSSDISHKDIDCHSERSEGSS